jgi:hypothetical protein
MAGQIRHLGKAARVLENRPVLRYIARSVFQRLAIANGHGWNRFLHTVDQVLPRRGDTIPLPLEMPPSSEDEEAANCGGLDVP